VSVKPPAFLVDLYRDLRDRRLLIPAGLLLVALVAVPFLLSESPPPDPPPPSTAGIEATAATPAVLTEDEGVRNYRERLDALTEKNPFDQQFADPPRSAGAIDEASSEATGTGGGTATGTGSALPADDGAGAAVASVPRGEPVIEVAEPTEDRWLTWQVDVSFGKVDDVKEYEGLRTLQLLPSKKRPVVAIFGISQQGKKVAFVLTDEVSSSSGDGRCSPGQKDCSFLVMKKGDKRRIVATRENGTRVVYRLKLRRITEKVITRPRE